MNEEQTKKEVKKITLGIVLGWGLGVLMIISSVTLLFSKPLTGVLMLLLSVVLLPPANKFVADKFKFAISGGLKFILVVVLLGVIGSSMSSDSSSSPTSDSSQTTNQEQPESTTIPAEYKSALSKAGSYANTMHMSKRGVYDQLVSEYGEKFTAEAAQYAIDNVKTNWNVNALAKAKNYQNVMHMSPAAIRDQLTSEYGEKFTQGEADYAIQHLND